MDSKGKGGDEDKEGWGRYPRFSVRRKEVEVKME
jgi:hypothetical protein